MIVIGGINCEELVAEFREGFGLLDGPTAQKGFLCPWGDRYTVAQALLGLSATTHIGELTLNTPKQYPERATMYAHDIGIQGVGFPQEGTNGVMAFYRAIISVNYQCLPWSFEGIDLGLYYNNIDPATPLIYCRQTMDYSTCWITIPHKGLKFAGGAFLHRDWKMPLCQIEMNLTFIRVPYLPGQVAFQVAKAPLNSTTFLGAPPGYVIFNGWRNEQTRDTAGNFTQDINMSFSFRSVPWDQDWNPLGAPAAFQQVQDGAGNPIMQRSDLNILIPPGYRLGF